MDPTRIASLERITSTMVNDGEPPSFGPRILQLARENEGIADLVELWERNPRDRNDIVVDLYGFLEDAEDTVGPILPAESELSCRAIAKMMRDGARCKERLRALVNAHGNLPLIAQKTEIPYTVIQRLLHGPAMPRKATIERIAQALGVTVESIQGDAGE